MGLKKEIKNRTTLRTESVHIESLGLTFTFKEPLFSDMKATMNEDGTPMTGSLGELIFMSKLLMSIESDDTLFQQSAPFGVDDIQDMSDEMSLQDFMRIQGCMNSLLKVSPLGKS